MCLTLPKHTVVLWHPVSHPNPPYLTLPYPHTLLTPPYSPPNLGGAHLPAIHIPIPVDRVASAIGHLRATSGASNLPSANISSTKPVSDGLGGSRHGGLGGSRHGVAAAEEENDRVYVLDRVKMTNIKQESFLKSHRSFTDLYDMCSSHQYEVIRHPMTMMTQRRNSFPSYAKME